MFDYIFTEQDAQRVVDALFGTITENDIVNMSWNDIVDWDAVLEEVQK